MIASDDKGLRRIEWEGTIIGTDDNAVDAGVNRTREQVGYRLGPNGTIDFLAGAWDEWVDPANKPARATVEARLASPAYKVEIAAVAAR